MNTKEKIIWGTSVLVLAVFVISTMLTPVIHKTGSYSGNASFGSTATSGVVVLTGTEITLLASSTLRNALIISPLSTCTGGAFISFANDVPATALNSVFVAASTTLLVNSNDFPYTGAIHGISNGTNCAVSVTGR